MGSRAHKTCSRSETVQDRTKVTITANTKSHMHFRLALISVTLDDLNGGNAPLAEVNKNSGAHQKNFNEDRFILSAAKCRPLGLFSRNIKYMQMFAGVPSEMGIM